VLALTIDFNVGLLPSSPGREYTSGHVWLPPKRPTAILQRPMWWRSGISSRWCSAETWGSRVLIVDDDVNLMRLLRTILRTAGFEVLTADQGIAALDLLAVESVDLIILDLRMPVIDGRTLYREMRSRGVAAPILIASAYGARSAQVELGAQGFIEKPFDPDRLVEAVNEAIASNTAADRR